MIAVQFPKLDIDDVEILIAKEISITVDIGLSFNIKQTLQNVGLLHFAVSEFVVPLPIGHVEHTMNHAQRIPVLEIGAVFQELQPRVDLEDLLEEHFEVLDCAELPAFVVAD